MDNDLLLTHKENNVNIRYQMAKALFVSFPNKGLEGGLINCFLTLFLGHYQIVRLC